MWCNKCWVFLESAKIEVSHLGNSDFSHLYLFPHEYLCFLANAQERLDKLEKIHQPDFSFKKIVFPNFQRFLSKYEVAKH